MPFQYSRRVHLADTDAAGVVYFARGLEMCHEAYEESLASSRIDLKRMLSKKKVALPIVQAEISFLRPLCCGDRITINLATNLVNSSEFVVEYQIFNVAEGDRVLIEAKTKHVCIEPNKRVRIDFPPTILNWLETNDKDCDIS